MNREQDIRKDAGAMRKPFDPPRLTPSTPEGETGERRPFVPPEVTAHESLPVITAGSVNLWN